MIHQFRDKKQIARRKSLIRNLFIFGIFLILCAVGFLSWSGKIFNSMGQPIWRAENAIKNKIESGSSLIRTKNSVFRENEQLRKDNEDLRLKMLDYGILKNENDQLKELMGRLPVSHNFILATILTKPNRSPYDTVIVDAGSDAGVAEGFQVFASGNVPIGEVSKVYNSDSLIMLYSNPGQITEAVIDGSNASVELVGRGGGNFEMSIPLDLPSENGTFVVLPNAKSEIIAIVDSVISNPTDPLKKVLLRSPANIQNLKWVQIKKD